MWVAVGMIDDSKDFEADASLGRVKCQAIPELITCSQWSGRGFVCNSLFDPASKNKSTL